MKVKLCIADAFFLLYLSFFLLYQIFLNDDFLRVIEVFRFYFGFFVFYIYFKSTDEISLEKLFWLVLVLVPVEALIVNSIISPHTMPNYPSADASSHFNPGGYQRPYSFAGNASVASNILVVFLAMYPFKKIAMFFSVFSVFVFSSGSGLISLILFFFMRFFRVFFVFLCLFLVFFVVYYSSLVSFLDSFDFKINSKYIDYLMDFKLNQIAVVFHGFTSMDYLFGNISSLSDGYGGDFGWLYFIAANGVISFVVLVFYLLTKVSAKTLMPIVLLLASTFHYPVIFFLSGQIVLGYLIARGSAKNM
ncbi:MAG: hypothetical protein HWE24_07890 [Oceanospirillaceae bacterium]|nr:hypothetical protein [Oceanospirillaceae bacterium]